MLDHCEECGTDFAFGLPACPNCQVPNARLARETAPAEEVPTPRPKPAAKKQDLPDDAPKIDSK